MSAPISRAVSRTSICSPVPRSCRRRSVGERVLEANSRLQLSRSVAQVAGPSLGGVLVQVVTAPLAMAVDALSFVVSAGFTWRIDVTEVSRAGAERGTIWREMLEGLRWVTAHPIIFRLMTSIALANFAWFGEQAVLVPFAYARARVGAGSAWHGAGRRWAGECAGALLVGRTTRHWGLGATMLAAVFLQGTSRLLPAFAVGPPWVAAGVLMLAQGLFGFVIPLWDVNSMSLRQTLTPEPLLGCVNASALLVAFSMAPLGALVGGWLGSNIGPRLTFVSMALVTFGAFVLLLRSPVAGLRVGNRA
jgi:hypothetical protein